MSIASPSNQPAFDAHLEALPCMAFLEHGDRIAAANSLASAFIRTQETLRIADLFAGAYPAAGDERRQRFDCLVLPQGGHPAQVSGAIHPYPSAGPSARLLLVMEPADTGTAVAVGHGNTTFLEDIFDAAPEAMVVFKDNRILHANREFVRMFGYPLETCLGADIYDLVLPDGHQHEREMTVHSVACEGRFTMETTRRTRTGDLLDVVVAVTAVRLGGDSVGLLATYRDIRTQKQAAARLRYTALHDPLTGLANRVLFLEGLSLTMARLERRPDRNFAVFFLDVDRFKQVNDTLGHAAGDTLLLAVTERLRSCLRPQDTIARFGGDEFALLLDDVGTIDDIDRLAVRIQTEIQMPVAIGEGEVFVSASMGIAVSSSTYTRPDDMLADADHAMYRAKANGKARHEFFMQRTLSLSAAEPDQPARAA